MKIKDSQNNTNTIANVPISQSGDMSSASESRKHNMAIIINITIVMITDITIFPIISYIFILYLNTKGVLPDNTGISSIRTHHPTGTPTHGGV